MDATNTDRDQPEVRYALFVTDEPLGDAKFLGVYASIAQIKATRAMTWKEPLWTLPANGSRNGLVVLESADTREDAEDDDFYPYYYALECEVGEEIEDSEETTAYTEGLAVVGTFPE